MDTWQPATFEEVQKLLSESLETVHPAHRANFETIRTDLRQVPVKDCPGEYVFVVAEHCGKLLYYSDIEDGWELEAPNKDGGIDWRGCSQYDFFHVMYTAFGDPDA